MNVQAVTIVKVLLLEEISERKHQNYFCLHATLPNLLNTGTLFYLTTPFTLYSDRFP